ncbi:hypothetical protein Peur_032225 [Populus x canadensis]
MVKMEKIKELELLKKTNSWFSTFKNLVLVAGVASLRTQVLISTHWPLFYCLGTCF